MMRTPTLFPEVVDDFSQQSPNITAGESNAGGARDSEQSASEPTPFHNRTLPSRAAAESARAFVRSQAVMVSEYIASQGERGATDKEIQTALAMDGNSQRPRRVWLRNNGFVQEKGHPDDIVLRDGSTVWVTVRPFGVATNGTRPDVTAAECKT